MSKKQSCCVVVDACVLRSAGDTAHPHSVHCANLLRVIFEAGHRVPICKEITAEWDKHASKCRYAIKWRARMNANKQLLRVDIEEQRDALVKKIDTCRKLSIKDRGALEKDVHLLAAAVVTDKVLLTQDKALKELATKALRLALEWLLVNQHQDSNAMREQLLVRLQELSRSQPYPPLPA